MALGFMRRHRRWLYGFLWVVIAAFIILYIPAFTGTSERGAGATLVACLRLADRISDAKAQLEAEA